jgi:MFS family permease
VTPLLSESPHTLPVHRRILLFAWLGWIFDFYDLYLLSLLLSATPLATELGMAQAQQSWVLGSSLGFSAIGGLLCGWLADRYGRKPMLMVTILIYSAGTCASGLAIDPWTLLFARALTGLGVGGEWAVAHTIVGETVPPGVRGRYGAALQSGAVIGLALATGIGSFLAPAIGWRLTFILSGVPALVVLAIRRHMPESDLWERHRAESSGARAAFAWPDPDHASAPKELAGGANLAILFGPALRRVTLLAFSMTVCAMAAYWLKNIWLPTYYQQVRGFSLAESAQLLWLGHAGQLAGYVCFGYAADRVGRRPSYCVFAFIKAAGLLMLTIGWHVAAVYPATLGMVILVVGFGEGNWGGVGPILSELFPTHLRAGALGLIYNTARGVQFVAPVLITTMASRYTFAEGIAVGAIFAVLSGLFVLTLPETRGITLKRTAE